MTGNVTPPDDDPAAEFVSQAQTPPAGFLAELWDFLKNNKKWWLTPIILLLLLLSALIVLGSTGVAPFIYALF